MTANAKMQIPCSRVRLKNKLLQFLYLLEVIHLWEYYKVIPCPCMTIDKFQH